MTVLHPESARAARRQEIADARREIDRRASVEAAAELFATNGFDGTTMAAIAQAAGLSLKNLYAAFASKDDLFEAVLADRFERHVRPVLETDRSGAAPAERVLGLVEQILEVMEADRAFLLLYARGSAGVPQTLREQGRDPYAKYVGEFQAHLVGLVGATRGADVSPDDLAAALTASLVALATRSVTADPPRPVTDAAGPLRALFGPALGATARAKRKTNRQED
jgi:AcrR family transcriptional regulator